VTLVDSESFLYGGGVMQARSVSDKPAITIGKSLSHSFERLQETIRQRAHHIFLKRDPQAGDAEGDWLHAQAEVLAPVELEVSEQKGSILVACDLAGFKPGEIEIEVQGNTLRILGSHEESRSSDAGGATLAESESRYFFRTLQLPCAVDAEKASAELLKKGRLKVKLPKKTTA
jgi:HSP20 family protein